MEKPWLMPEYTPTYILTWNPRRFIWDDYKQLADDLKCEGTLCCESNWTCKSKSPEKGDRFVLLMQGMKDKNGIVGAGIFLSAPYDISHDTAYGKRFVDISLVMLKDYDNDRYVRTSELKDLFPNQCWTPQCSGTRIRSSYLPDMWKMIGFLA